MYEVRKVPASWEHPKNEDGSYHPLIHDRWDSIDYSDYEDDAGGLMFSEDDFDNIPPAQQTHYQLYEAVSHGTPVSPVFATKDELIDWCTENMTTGFASAIPEALRKGVMRTAVDYVYRKYSNIDTKHLTPKPALNELLTKLENSVPDSKAPRDTWEIAIIAGDVGGARVIYNTTEKTLGVCTGFTDTPTEVFPIPPVYELFEAPAKFMDYLGDLTIHSTSSITGDVNE
jgi:hypothetical protein